MWDMVVFDPETAVFLIIVGTPNQCLAQAGCLRIPTHWALGPNPSAILEFDRPAETTDKT